MRSRRAAIWKDQRETWAKLLKPGAVVAPVYLALDSQNMWGVVERVNLAENKVYVAWQGMRPVTQHAPDEVMLHPEGSWVADQAKALLEQPVQDTKTAALSVPQQHQKNIAIKTLKMNDAMARVMGGMSKEEAREFLKSIGWSEQKIRQIEASALEEDAKTASAEAYAALRSRRGVYYMEAPRVYRRTRTEFESGELKCPKCGGAMAKEPFLKSEKVYVCQDCRFKVPASKLAGAA